MSEIAIRLDPAALANPDLDLRYTLPAALVACAPALLRDDAYDYDAAGRMLVFLAIPDAPGAADAALAIVLAALATLELHGNTFAAGVTVAIADATHCADLAAFRIVSPLAGGTLADA